MQPGAMPGARYTQKIEGVWVWDLFTQIEVNPRAKKKKGNK